MIRGRPVLVRSHGVARKRVAAGRKGDTRYLYWSVTANILSPTVQELLRDWAAQTLEGMDGLREMDRYMPMIVSTSQVEFHYSIGDLGYRSLQEARPRDYEGRGASLAARG
jgi:hypothetical protein